VKCRLAILSEIIAPYRIPVFSVLAARSDIDLQVMFLSETDPSLRQWDVHKEEIHFSYQVLPCWRRRLGRYNLLVNRGLTAALSEFRPQAVVCGGYNYLASWQAAGWAKRNKVPLLLWSESTKSDLRRELRIVEGMKTRFVRMCSASIAAGISSREYLIQLGAPDETIFIAPDAVDNAFYAARAQQARARADEVRSRLNLPSRYFLFVGRLVREKGIFELLEAYSRLDDNERSQVGLVIAGDGSLRAAVEKQASAIRVGCVRFTGFAQREPLAELYALAEALVFPTQSDPWGLVVNEAMACGLPVIASKVAGCAADLVRNADNGFIVAPGDVAQLTIALSKLLSDPQHTADMGARSAQRIQAFTPEACAEGIANAARFASFMKSSGK
jgi:1,2-diacylglycerol 3-alpha-glucosyltransferase